MKVFATGVMKGRPLDSVGPYIIKKFKGQDVAQFRNGAMAYFEEVQKQQMDTAEIPQTPSFILPPGIPVPMQSSSNVEIIFEKQAEEFGFKKFDWRKLYHPSYMPQPWLYGAAVLGGGMVGLLILKYFG